MTQLSQKELLGELEKAVGIKTVAYEQIKEMIQRQGEEYQSGYNEGLLHGTMMAEEKLPEITEQWAGKRALKILTLIKQAQDEDLEDPAMSLHYLGLCMDLITSFLTELSLKIKGKKRRGGCPPDFIPGDEE